MVSISRMLHSPVRAAERESRIVRFPSLYTLVVTLFLSVPFVSCQDGGAFERVAHRGVGKTVKERDGRASDRGGVSGEGIG